MKKKKNIKRQKYREGAAAVKVYDMTPVTDAICCGMWDVNSKEVSSNLSIISDSQDKLTRLHAAG